MTTEREQLELAAKACGIEGAWVESNHCIQLGTGPLRLRKHLKRATVTTSRILVVSGPKLTHTKTVWMRSSAY